MSAPAPSQSPPSVVWTQDYLSYQLSPDHPLDPVRLDLTMRLATELGVLDGVETLTPTAAPDSQLLRIHTPGYLAAVKGAPGQLQAVGHGLGSEDNPIFERMHEASALLTGGSLAAAREIAAGRTRRAVTIGGGLHHAMADSASGFCVYNDAAVAISWLLDHGFDRIAYVDVDVHHGDGVQAAFLHDPRVLTISVHQHPATLWPSTGWSHEAGTGAAAGSVVNLPLMPGTADGAWLRAFHAVVPGALRAFRPQLLVTQCGVDTHREDPLADLRLTVDGHRAAFTALRDLAEETAEGRWLALGGGGYGLVRVVPRSWTHLLATVLDRDVDPATPLPPAWVEHVRAGWPGVELPAGMGDGGDVQHEPWGAGSARPPAPPRPGSTAPSATPGARCTRCSVSTPTTRGTEMTDPAQPPTPPPVTPPTPSPPHPAARRPAPRHWEADVLASDGGTVHLRPITPADAEALVAFHGKLSERTRYLRYFGPYPTMPPRDVVYFSTVDHHDRVALIALLGDEIIAVGRYDRLPNVGDGTSAEVAFVVADAHQGRGLGSVLLEHLAAAAADTGVTRFVAEVLAENPGMVRVFRDAGYQISRSFEGGVLHLEFAVDPSTERESVRNSRERASEARSVRNVLAPRSVAVIGASTDPSKVGHAVLVNLLRGGFTGPVYPVNAEHRSVQGVRAYATVRDIPDPVDLAVVAVPADRVEAVLDDCLAKGVTALVVVSAGFGETGEEGLHAERRMVRAARAHGMRVVGPSALGVANTDPAVNLNATLAPVLPGRGRVGFFCQSGALGIAILAAAAERGLGLSTFVSAGNRADLSGNDLMQYWHSDPATDVVLLYLESFGNPRKFGRLARNLARTKPVVAVKSGRHAVRPGLAATSVTVDEASVQALFEQAGVIRVESIAQLFDVALLVGYQPLPAGRRVAVVGNSSALGVLAVDAARAQELEVVGDAVDVGATASPAEFAAAVAQALASDDVDALIAVFVPPVATPGAAFATALREAVTDAGKPVVTTFLAAEGIPDSLAVLDADGVPSRGSVPSYPGPERAVLALSRAVRYAAWRERPLPEVVRPTGVDEPAVRALVDGWLAADPDGRWLTDDEAAQVLRAYGIEVTEFRTRRGVDAAVAAAAELGYPVAVKATGERWRHRSDFVGVRLDLPGPESVRAACAELAAVTGDDEVHVQRMATKGISCTVGVQDDPSFGSLVSFGLAGVISDLLGDHAYRLLPVTPLDAHDLVRAPRAAPLLAGYRGTEPVDLDALEDLVLRVATLADDVHELREVSCEPVLASATGAAVTGARLRVGPPPTRADLGPRRLR